MASLGTATYKEPTDLISIFVTNANTTDSEVRIC